MNCECKPQLTKSKTGTVVVEHVKMGKGRDLWHMEFGINGKKVEVVDFLDGESPKNIDKFLKAIQNALPKFGSD